MEKIKHIEQIESAYKELQDAFTDFMDSVDVNKLNNNLTETEREKANNLMIAVSNLTMNK